METLCAGLVGVMIAASIYLILDRNLIRFIFGLILASNAINLLIFTVGRLDSQHPPLIPNPATAVQGPFANALPQALILTAIVIGFALLSFVFVLYRPTGGFDGAARPRSHQQSLDGHGHVDLAGGNHFDTPDMVRNDARFLQREFVRNATIDLGQFVQTDFSGKPRLA